MNFNIETFRHSLAHVLALAVKELYPKVKFAMGPAIENGFYYDFEFPNKLTPEELKNIEKRMQEIIKKNLSFKKQTVDKPTARKMFKDQPYKLEILKDLPGKEVTLYQCGDFIDICKGPHLRSTKLIPTDAFKLTRIAGAYWKGSEENIMITRIYGIAFENKKELDAYLVREKEAEKRDHRLLGQQLDLFHIDEEVGPGLILWHPKGALLKKTIMDYALQKYLRTGYQLVDTPHIGKLSLWETSGHCGFYKENMMPPMHMQEITKEEKDDYQIKPMNCPFHIIIYKTAIRSYKDLPLRFTEMGTVYRYERSGTLHGLTRVRQITQDDAHIFCTADQLGEELSNTLDLTFQILKDFGFKEFNIYLSTQPKKFVGAPKIWRIAEQSLKYALGKLKLPYEIDVGGGAFYGPKIDIKIKDAIGRLWQCSTIQVDLNLPERFKVNYINPKGEKEQVIMIHRALLGSLERFIGILLEYYGGALPFWLSPDQIWVIPISKNHEKYAQKITNELFSLNYRAILKDENETISKKIRAGEIQKIPYLLIIGDREMKNKEISIRERGKGDLGAMSLSKFLNKIK